MEKQVSRSRVILARAKRRQRIRKFVTRRIVPAVLALTLIFVFSITGKAADKKQNLNFKYFANVMVTPGQDLEDLAMDYCKTDTDLDSYLDEVRYINHLEADGTVTPGDFLILPYYSEEFK